MMQRTVVLADGTSGLTDGLVAGNWRIPNSKEM